MTEWLPWLQTNWRDSGYERFALVLRLIAKGTAAQFIIQPQYTENPIFVVPSPGYKFLTATLKCICNDSFTDVLRVVSVLWFNELGMQLPIELPYGISFCQRLAKLSVTCSMEKRGHPVT